MLIQCTKALLDKMNITGNELKSPIEYEERPGEFKKHDYVTGVYEVGSVAEDVENDLTELIAKVNAYEGKGRLFWVKRSL